MKNILVLLGPNLNMVGVREKGVYGTENADSIKAQIEKWAYEILLTRARLLITAMLSATRSRVSIYPLLRFICLIFTQGKSSATLP